MSVQAFSSANAAPNKASTRKVLEKGLANRRAATDLINQMGSHYVAALIVATNVSQTIDFAQLAAADKVVVVPAAAGNSHFVTVATAGTLGEAAVVGSLYIVLRANSI